MGERGWPGIILSDPWARWEQARSEGRRIKPAEGTQEDREQPGRTLEGRGATPGWRVTQKVFSQEILTSRNVASSRHWLITAGRFWGWAKWSLALTHLQFPEPGSHLSLCLWLAVSASSRGCHDQAGETCSPLPPSWSSAGPCPAPKCSSGVSPSLLRWQEKKWPQAQFLEPRAWALSQGQLELQREAGASPTGSTGGTGSVGISEKREQRLLQGAGSRGGLNSHPSPSVQPRGRMETGTGHSQLIPRESPYK